MTTKPIADVPPTAPPKPKRLSKRERAEKLLREDRADELWQTVKFAAAGMRLAASERDAAEACGHADAALQALEELDRISKNEAADG